ncbi:hypothetical protein GCM10020218_050220 [Dactylosporangium vinaceum]
MAEHDQQPDPDRQVSGRRGVERVDPAHVHDPRVQQRAQRHQPDRDPGPHGEAPTLPRDGQHDERQRHGGVEHRERQPGEVLEQERDIVRTSTVISLKEEMPLRLRALLEHQSAP